MENMPTLIHFFWLARQWDGPAQLTINYYNNIQMYFLSHSDISHIPMCKDTRFGHFRRFASVRQRALLRYRWVYSDEKSGDP